MFVLTKRKISNVGSFNEILSLLKNVALEPSENKKTLEMKLSDEATAVPTIFKSHKRTIVLG